MRNARKSLRHHDLIASWRCRRHALPDDPGTLKAMLLAERARDRAAATRSSRSCSATASVDAPRRCPKINCCSGSKTSSRSKRRARPRPRRAAPAERAQRAAKRRTNRGSLPAHLPRIEMVVDIDDHSLPVLPRRAASDRRGRRRTARHHPGPVPGAGGAPAQSMPAAPARRWWSRRRRRRG